MSFVQDQLAGYGDFFQAVDEAQSYLDRESYVLKDYRPKGWQHARELERGIDVVGAQADSGRLLVSQRCRLQRPQQLDVSAAEVRIE